MPGLDRPSLARRSDQEFIDSPIVVAMGLAKRRELKKSNDEVMMGNDQP